jgi:hypothetical protein
MGALRGYAVATAALLLLLFVGVFVVRPALVLGNDPRAVAESLADELDGLNGYRTTDHPDDLGHSCAKTERADVDLVCSIETVPDGEVGSGASTRLWQYTVDIDRFGCWDARPAPAGADTSRPATAEACLGLTDY